MVPCPCASPGEGHRSKLARHSPVVREEEKAMILYYRGPEETSVPGVSEHKYGVKNQIIRNNTCIYTGELGLSDQYQRKEVF